MSSQPTFCKIVKMLESCSVCVLCKDFETIVGGIWVGILSTKKHKNIYTTKGNGKRLSVLYLLSEIAAVVLSLNLQ